MKAWSLVLLLPIVAVAASADTKTGPIRKIDPKLGRMSTGSTGQKPTDLNGVQINKSGFLLANKIGLLRGTIGAITSAGSPAYKTKDGLVLSVAEPADRKSSTGSNFYAKGVIWDPDGRNSVVGGSSDAELRMQVPAVDTWWTVAAWFGNLPTGLHMYLLTVKLDCGAAKPTIAVGDQLFTGNAVNLVPGEARVVFFYDPKADPQHGVLVCVGSKLPEGSSSMWKFRSIQMKTTE